MATPDFVLDLLAKIGHDLLWLSGVTAVVLRDTASASREVLLVKRAVTGEWTPVTGIVDPGEGVLQLFADGWTRGEGNGRESSADE